MSYFDFFCQNIVEKSFQDDDIIQGTCCSLCPQEEVIMREKEKIVHVLEVNGLTRTLIKSYSRSAADAKMAIPRLLRPFPTLKDTVKYLLFEITKREDVPETVVYDFIDDRLRAVRQDMTIQRIPPEQSAILLEPMIRFYVYYAYKLCEHPIKDFDPTLNKKHLLECLKWFLNCCDNKNQFENDESVSELNGFLSAFEISHENKLPYDRAMMESLYILCNLDNLHPLFRYLTLPKHLKRHLTLKVAYDIAILNLNGNYFKVCRLIKKLCPLTFCAVVLHLPVLQRYALQVMCTAYSSKQLNVSAHVVREWLQFSSDEHVVTTCKHYGLKTERNAVHFVKGSFKIDVPVLQSRKLSSTDFDLKSIFTLKTNE